MTTPFFIVFTGLFLIGVGFLLGKLRARLNAYIERAEAGEDAEAHKTGVLVSR